VHLVGGKDTGKSTVLKVGAAVFGARKANGYSGRLGDSAIVRKSGGGANFAQSEARGVRFLFLSEPSTDRTDDGFLKNLSGGGEPITTERKNRDQEEWDAECVLFIAANTVVRFQTKDRALVDRINILEFTERVSPHEVDRLFTEKLVEQEGAGILMWMMEGAFRYRQQGHIVVPPSIQQRAIKHVVDSSAPLRWLTEVTRLGGPLVIDPTIAPSNMMTPKVCFEMFGTWCADNNERKPSNANWRAEIETHLGAPPGWSDRRPGGSARLYSVIDATSPHAQSSAHGDSDGTLNVLEALDIM
jgi:phage/plasmid-associated DNA primase